MASGKYKYWLQPEQLEKLTMWARDGLTNEQIAQKMGVTRTTLQNWVKKYVDIFDALKKGKDVVDAKVEDSLIKTIHGYKTETLVYRNVKKSELKLKADRTVYMKQYKLDHPDASNEEIQIATLNGVSEYEEILATRTVTEVGPNTSAIIFWLKNRRPDIYRDQSFARLNEANAKKTEIEARIAETQLKQMQDADNPDNQTIIVDDVAKMKELMKHEDSTDNERD